MNYVCKHDDFLELFNKSLGESKKYSIFETEESFEIYREVTYWSRPVEKNETVIPLN